MKNLTRGGEDNSVVISDVELNSFSVIAQKFVGILLFRDFQSLFNSRIYPHSRFQDVLKKSKWKNSNKVWKTKKNQLIVK
jgi:hypothetical protein